MAYLQAQDKRIEYSRNRVDDHLRLVQSAVLPHLETAEHHPQVVGQQQKVHLLRVAFGLCQDKGKLDSCTARRVLHPVLPKHQMVLEGQQQVLFISYYNCYSVSRLPSVLRERKYLLQC